MGRDAFSLPSSSSTTPLNSEPPSPALTRSPSVVAALAMTNPSPLSATTAQRYAAATGNSTTAILARQAFAKSRENIPDAYAQASQRATETLQNGTPMPATIPSAKDPSDLTQEIDLKKAIGQAAKRMLPAALASGRTGQLRGDAIAAAAKIGYLEGKRLFSGASENDLDGVPSSPQARHDEPTKNEPPEPPEPH